MIINNTEYVTIQEASEILGLHYLTVRKYTIIGMLPVIKFSPRKIFIKKDDVINMKGV